MKQVFPRMVMILGIILITTAAVQLYQLKESQEKALDKAKILVERDTNSSLHDLGMFEDYKNGEIAGILLIPKLERELPIVLGVNEDELSRGVGHYPGSSFPSQRGQIVLSGHRDTVFTKLGDLEIGDEFKIKMPYGEFVYKIKETFIVAADDTTVIDSSIIEELLTITTCYPFSYVGNAPKRYIIHAIRY